LLAALASSRLSAQAPAPRRARQSGGGRDHGRANSKHFRWLNLTVNPVLNYRWYSNTRQPIPLQSKKMNTARSVFLQAVAMNEKGVSSREIRLHLIARSRCIPSSRLVGDEGNYELIFVSGERITFDGKDYHFVWGI
jgi:hypothetical protein